MKTINQRGTAQASADRRLPRRGRHWPATGALAAAVLGLTLAVGCSSAARTGSGTGLSVSQGDQEMVSFARCMRAHGVPTSDPFHRPGHTGLTLNLPTRDAATRPAYAACIHFIAPLVRIKQAGAAARAAPHLAALTRYAECMRAHDIAMLDPTPQGELQLGRVPGLAPYYGRYTPQFRSADAACRHLLPPGVTDDGTGP
ncbi:MAG: hypothetical protein J2P29_11780 [Actinobacteria bacterium]|nr:hypothetical protein [Actinomycetota bacterium]